MVLRGRNVENFDDLSLAAWSRGLPICVSSTTFQKASAGLNSLQQKGYQMLVKNWIFDDPFHKKEPLLVILVPRMFQPSGSVIFSMKWGCRGHWGCWGCWGHWGCRGSRAWKITTGDFRVIQVLEFSFILMFWKNLYGGWNHEVSGWILALFLSEAVEASRCYFFENLLTKHKWVTLVIMQLEIYHKNYQSCYPSEPFKKPYHYETPCTKVRSS